MSVLQGVSRNGQGGEGSTRPAASRDQVLAAGAQMTARGLRFRGDIAFEEWLDLGRRISRVSSGCAWSLGDWINFGQAAYGERYRAALELTDFDAQTLRNYAWVCRRVEMSRRRDNLSFQHHAEVAALPEPEQELWLERATSMRWSRNALRRAVRTHGSGAGDGEPGGAVVLRLAVDARREQRWREAAARSELTLVAWLAAAADTAAESTLGARRSTP